MSVLGELRRATDFLGSAAESADQLSADLGTDAQKLYAVAANYAEADSTVRVRLQSLLDRAGSEGKSGLDIEQETKGAGANTILNLLSGLDDEAPEPAPPAAPKPPKPGPAPRPKKKPHPPAPPRHGTGGHSGGAHGGGAHGGSGHSGKRGGVKPGGSTPHVPRPGSGGNGVGKRRGGGNGKAERGGSGHATGPGGSADPPRSPHYANQPQIVRWVGEAFAVMKVHGVPASELDTEDVLLIIEHESGGDPNAINRTDINARIGDPSRGLMQTIGSTFDAYALPGYNRSIYDPIDNIIAGCRYAIARYGSLAAVPGVRAVKAGRPYIGY